MIETAVSGQRDGSVRPEPAHHLAPAVERARAARETARLQRAHARRSREAARQQCQESIQIRWRARRLCYDSHGPILAMWDGATREDPGDRPEQPHPLEQLHQLEQPHPLEQIDNADSVALASMAIERLFGVGLTLASCRAMIPDGAGSDRVDRAMDEIDVLIRDLRTAVFADHKLDAGGARSELRQSLPHLIDLANIAQAESSPTADHLNLTHTLQRALLELDWITE